MLLVSVSILKDQLFDDFLERITTRLREKLNVSYIPFNRFLCSKTSANTPVTKSDLEGTILYIGGESLGLTNLLITHSASSVRILLCVGSERAQVSIGLLLQPEH